MQVKYYNVHEVIEVVTDLEVQNFRDNLTLIRRSVGWSAEEFGKRVGISRQSINNLESGKYKLTKPHYVAMRYVLNEEIKNNPRDTDMLRIVLEVFVDNPDKDIYTDEVKKEIKQKAMLLSPALEMKVAPRKEVSETWKSVLSGIAATAIATALVSLIVGIWKNK